MARRLEVELGLGVVLLDQNCNLTLTILLSFRDLLGSFLILASLVKLLTGLLRAPTPCKITSRHRCLLSLLALACRGKHTLAARDALSSIRPALL